MGTMFRIALYAADQQLASQASEAAFRRIAALEDITSDYMADSEIKQLCAHPPGQPVPVSRDLFRVLSEANKISRLSDGVFDVTAGHYTWHWRFARKRGRLPSAEALAAAREVTGWHYLHLEEEAQTVTIEKKGMRLDLGGIAKGYAADQALRVLQEHGITRALVAASGDIVVGDPPPGKNGWRIQVAALGGQQSLTLSLATAAVSTSGDTEQFIEIDGVRYSHIVSPITGLGLTNRVQATVVAPNGTTSDPLGTTCCILGPERALDLVEGLDGVELLLSTVSASATNLIRSAGFGQLVLPE